MKALWAVLFLAVLANAVRIKHSVEVDLHQMDLQNSLAQRIVEYTNALDLILPKYAPYPINLVLANITAEIALVHQEFLTPSTPQLMGSTLNPVMV